MKSENIYIHTNLDDESERVRTITPEPFQQTVDEKNRFSYLRNGIDRHESFLPPINTKSQTSNTFKMRNGSLKEESKPDSGSLKMTITKNYDSGTTKDLGSLNLYRKRRYEK